MKGRLAILAVAVVLVSTVARALDRSEAWNMARTGDAAALEMAFSAHQAAFNAGEIGPGAYRAPYTAIRTTDPVVERTIVAWRNAYPASPHAAFAEAARLTHIAHLIRGDDFAFRVPTGAMAQFTRLASEARRLLNTVLESEPRHLAAAHTLMHVGAFLGVNRRSILTPDWSGPLRADTIRRHL